MQIQSHDVQYYDLSISQKKIHFLKIEIWDFVQFWALPGPLCVAQNVHILMITESILSQTWASLEYTSFLKEDFM